MITIVDYDPDWPVQYERSAAQLATVVPSSWAIEHIGSTSVPGLPAKPIIDLAVRADTITAVDELTPQLRAIGWYPIMTQPTGHRVLVRMKGDERTHIAHFFPAADWEDVHQRVFATWLRNHPDDRDRYAQAKRKASLEAEDGRDYTLHKRAVVKEITDRARADLGLPAVADWDA